MSGTAEELDDEALAAARQALAWRHDDFRDEDRWHDDARAAVTAYLAVLASR